MTTSVMSILLHGRRRDPRHFAEFLMSSALPWLISSNLRIISYCREKLRRNLSPWQSSRQHHAPSSLRRPLAFISYSSSYLSASVRGVDASGFEVISERSEYANSRSALDISLCYYQVCIHFPRKIPTNSCFTYTSKNVPQILYTSPHSLDVSIKAVHRVLGIFCVNIECGMIHASIERRSCSWHWKMLR